ncbi:MAG: hypothetical protein V7605_1882 [Acidimicrobiaceae bacterium]
MPLSVAVFVMGLQGHVQRVLPVIAALTERDVDVSVFTDAGFADIVGQAGGRFVDLYRGRPLEAADDESRPVPSRYVTFAAVFGDQIAAEVGRLGPSLVLSDSFAFVGRLVAGILDLPHVDLRAGHDADPDRIAERVEASRVRTSLRCHQAVATLRDRYGWEDASPFSYDTHVSPLLNICAEPAAFVSAHTRRALEPVDYFGSLPPATEIERRRHPPARPWFGPDRAELQVYASFGTVAWWYYAGQALRSLQAIADAVDARPGASAVISLGNAEVTDEQADALTRASVTVKRFVDQWQVLAEADVFVTHHGLNSTHEAIFHEVPMISHPFFHDQPPMAATCRRLEVAVSMARGAGQPVRRGDVDTALDRCQADRGRLEQALARARAWELDVIAHRPEVVERIIGLA